MTNSFNNIGFGCRVKKLRRSKDLTQTELGKLLGVTKVSICGYESGKRIPSLDIFCEMANILGVTTDYLLGNDYKVNNINICDEDLELINTIRKNDKVYKYLFKNGDRAIKYFSKKIGDN